MMNEKTHRKYIAFLFKNIFGRIGFLKRPVGMFRPTRFWGLQIPGSLVPDYKSGTAGVLFS
jgi:hypothetical protein